MDLWDNSKKIGHFEKTKQGPCPNGGDRGATSLLDGGQPCGAGVQGAFCSGEPKVSLHNYIAGS
jgi:hypothetical protein